MIIPVTRFAARRLIVNVSSAQRAALELEASRKSTTVSEVVRGLIAALGSGARFGRHVEAVESEPVRETAK